MGKQVNYKVSEINAWCHDLLKHARSIDRIISDAIWFNWKRIEEGQELWIKSQGVNVS